MITRWDTQEQAEDFAEETPELPVLAMSLHPEAEYRSALHASGATDYVSKGSAAPVIAAAVRSALGIP